VILYKNDQSLPLKVITTVKGKKEYRRNCTFIQEKYYLKEEDAFLVNNKWYRKDSGKIEFDHEVKAWVLKSEVKLFNGIIDITSSGSPVMGHFSANPYKNVDCWYDGNTVKAQNSDFLKKHGYFEDIGFCKWYPRTKVTDQQYQKMISIRNEVDHHRKGYNIEDNKVEYEQKKLAYKEFPTEITKEVRRYARFLGDITYGFEIEADQGNLDEPTQNKCGTVICRDGSIHGPEICLVPMSGAKGVQTLVNLAQELQKRVTIDMSCSVHIHVGNVPVDRKSLVVYYVLFYKIQDELFKMFPYYKTDCRGLKKKNYCHKLKKMSIHPLVDCSKEGYESYIDEVYVKLFTFLSCGTPPSEDTNRGHLQHPIRDKWSRDSRYFGLNLINTIFHPSKTVEFRLFTPSLSAYKYTMWLYFVNSFIKYAEHNAEAILTAKKKISILDVFSYYQSAFPGNEDAIFLTRYLCEFYESQCKRFAADKAKEDYISEHDIRLDSKFEFKVDGRALF